MWGDNVSFTIYTVRSHVLNYDNNCVLFSGSDALCPSVFDSFLCNRMISDYCYTLFNNWCCYITRRRCEEEQGDKERRQGDNEMLMRQMSTHTPLVPQVSPSLVCLETGNRMTSRKGGWDHYATVIWSVQLDDTWSLMIINDLDNKYNSVCNQWEQSPPLQRETLLNVLFHGVIWSLYTVHCTVYVTTKLQRKKTQQKLQATNHTWLTYQYTCGLELVK